MLYGLRVIRLLPALAATLALLGGCAPAKVVKQWTDPTRTGPGYKKVMVMTVWDEARPRQIFEDGFVRELKAAGIDAIPSYPYLAENGKVQRDRIVEAVDKAGADSLLVSILVGRSEKTAYSGDDTAELGGGIVAGEDITVAWVGVVVNAGETDMTVWTVESRLFDARARKQVWRGISTLRDPANLYKGTSMLAQLLLKDLREQKLLQ